MAQPDTVGSRANAEWGFKPSDSSVVTYGGTNIGYLRGDIDTSLPRDYAYMQLDQDILDIDAVCIKKDWTVSLAADEALLVNLAFAWDNAAPAAGPPAVLTVNATMSTTAALLVNTKPPNSDSNDTRVMSLPTALSVGDGAYSIPNARSGAIQSVAMQFKAIASASAGLLGTVTDTYNA